jgi:hypothetical protein
MNTKLALFGFALPFVFLACNSDSGSTPAGPNTPDPNGTGSQLCAEMNPLFSSRFLPDDTDQNDVIRDIVVDGPDVFFRTYKAAYRVPAAGGEPVRLDAEKPGQYVSSLHKVGARVFLFSMDNHQGMLQELPRTGVAATPLAAPIMPTDEETDVRKALLMDETHIYFLTDEFIQGAESSGGYSASFLNRAPWAGGATEQLVDLDSARIRKLFKQGDRLYYARMTAASYWNKSDGVFSLPASGGTPVPVNALTAPQTLTDIYAIDGASLYLNIVADPLLYKYGVSKVPLAGGTPALMVDVQASSFWLDAGRLIYTAYQQVKTAPNALDNWATGIYTVPPGGGAATYTGCVPEGLGAGKFSIQAETFAGGALYMAMTGNGDGKNTIIKYTVP